MSHGKVIWMMTMMQKGWRNAVEECVNRILSGSHNLCYRPFSVWGSNLVRSAHFWNV